MNIDLAGKVILVTGGTGTLGSQLVKRALAEKAVVFFTYFKNEEQSRALIQAGGRGIQTDLGSSAGIEKLKEEIKKQTPFLDGLVNNAGIVRDHTLTNLRDDDFDEVLRVDLTAAFLMIKKFLPLLYKKEGGKVVNVVSRVGIQGGFGEANYAAAKAGLVALTKTLAWETGRKKICANAVAPGFMLSKITENLPEAVYEKQKNDSCFGSFSDPAEVADFIIYLLSNAVRNVSGQVFMFDSRKTKIF